MSANIKATVSLLALNKKDKIEDFFKILKKHEIRYVEIPISKILNDYELDKNKLTKFKNLLYKYHLKVSCVQSIFFGRPELNVFNPKKNNEILEHLLKVIKISRFIGCSKLIFGSPINRFFFKKKSKKNNAIIIFKKIANICKKNKVIFCIEPNAKFYNCNYINNISQAKLLVEKINSKFFKINFDTGNFFLENDKLNDLKKLNKLIVNFQISEKKLKGLENSTINHRKILSNFKINKRNVSFESSNLNIKKLNENILIFKQIIGSL